ncbi:MAG: LCP family protein [Clostridia bacterium]|nr:LCP family protein [Clostridia bacterium]
MDNINIIIDKIKDFFEKINSLSFLNRTPSKKFIITAFIFIILIIGIFSAVTVISERGEDGTETTGNEDTQAVASAVEEKDMQELKGNFLFALTRDGNEKIELLSLVRLDSENKKVSISFISPEEITSVNGFLGNMHEHLKNGGINELMWSVGELARISIEGYVIGDEQNFIDFIKSLGEIEINITDKVTYTHRGIPIIIEEGVQKLSADIMLKYFVYLCDNYETVTEKLVEAMIIYGKKMFDSTEDSVLDDSFGKMLRYFNTDISVVDFTNYRKAVKNLASSKNHVEIIIEADPSNLK